MDDVDNYITPKNMISLMETLGIDDDTINDFEATDDGGLIINIRNLVKRVSFEYIVVYNSAIRPSTTCFS